MKTEEKSSRVFLESVNPVSFVRRWAIFHMCISVYALSHCVYELITRDYALFLIHFTHRDLSRKLLCVGTVIRIVVYMLSVLFCALLYYGLMKRKASYVKAYFVYVIIKYVLIVLAASFFTVVGAMHGNVQFWYISLLIMVFSLCLVVLVMVRRTYILFKAVQDDRNTLVDHEQAMDARPALKAAYLK